MKENSKKETVNIDEKYGVKTYKEAGEERIFYCNSYREKHNMPLMKEGESVISTCGRRLFF